MKQKKNSENFFSKWLTQKNWVFFKLANSHKFFVKISWIGPWVSRIDWCEGHWCGSTYMVERLSEVGSKTGKFFIFCVFCLFLSLPWTASRPYRLSHIIALYINQSYWPKDQSMKVWQKIFENWRFWKTQFFLIRPILDLFFSNIFFFASSPWKLVKVSWVSRMGRNFDDYPGFQPKITSPKHFSLPVVYLPRLVNVVCERP